MRTSTSTLIAVAIGAKLGLSQLECSGALAPTWEHCNEVWEYFDLAGGEEVVHRISDNDCEWWFWDVEGGNCRITHCFDGRWQGADEEVTGWDLTGYYNAIKARCEPIRAGGLHPIRYPPEGATGGAEYLSVYNDEGNNQGKLMARGDAIDHGNGFSQGSLTRAEFDQWLSETTGVQSKRTPIEASQSSKRQIDDDEEWAEIEFSALAIRNHDEKVLGPRLSNGLGYKYSVSEGRTFTTKTSMSIGAAWNIFTASAGIEMSQEDSFTTTEEFTFDVTCSNQAQITYYPFYDFYEVYFLKSEERVEIWVPVVSGDNINGEIAIDCVN